MRQDSTPKTLNFCLLHFLWFLDIFFSNLRYCVQYTTWRHNTLLFSHCENFSVWKYSLWRYHFYSNNKTRYFTAENVIKLYILITKDNFSKKMNGRKRLSCCYWNCHKINYVFCLIILEFIVCDPLLSLNVKSSLRAVYALFLSFCSKTGC